MAGREEPPKAEAWSRYGRTSAESRGIAFAPHPLPCVISFPSTRFLPRSRFLVMLSSALARRSVASARGCALALRLVQRQGRPPRRHSRCAVRLLPVISHTHVASPRHHRGLQGRQGPTQNQSGRWCLQRRERQALHLAQRAKGPLLRLKRSLDAN